jgi:hypothetical protein
VDVRAWGLVLVLAAGCDGGGTDDTSTGDTDLNGACGEVTNHDVTVTGVVETAGGPAEGATVYVEERAWTGGMRMGTAQSAADGTFTIEVADLISVEDCWGTALDYYVVAEAGDLYGERGINSTLFNALSTGEADLSGAPLLIE